MKTWNGKIKFLNGKSDFGIQAKHLMSRHLITLANSDTMSQAAGVFLDRNISGAPVLNHLGEPVGVLTKTDLMRYERECLLSRVTEETKKAMKGLGTLESIAESSGYHRETEEDYVSHWMTPKVYAVNVQASFVDVLRQMIRRRVHRLFVWDMGKGRLVGVISTFDVLKFVGRVFMVNQTAQPSRRALRQRRLADAS